MNIKQILLKEELEKFNSLLEYDFYTPEPLNEEDPEEEAPDGDVDGDMEEPVGDVDGGEAPMDAGDDIEEPIEDEPIDGGDDIDVDADINMDAEIEEPVEDEVEVDITDLVKNSEEEQERISHLDNKLDQTQQLLQNMASRFDKMDAITNRLDSIESEIEKRNPTPQEKLEMMSLKSYPYNLKISDYWDSKEGNYDAMNQNFKKEPEEYVLTQKDVDDDYSDVGIKKTF